MNQTTFTYNSIKIKSFSFSLFVFIQTTIVFAAPNPFITTWKTDNAGSTGPTEIQIPTNPSYSYNYNVDWDNDGNFDEFGLTGDVVHDFGAPGTYTIQIEGDFPAIFFNNDYDREKIISIDQWGGVFLAKF